MQRPISTLLILFLLAGQGLFSVPHSHAGSSVVAPHGHNAASHFHLSLHLSLAHHNHDGEEHHDSEEYGGEKSPSSTGEQLPDHDSDAIYVGDVQLLNDGKVTKVADAHAAAHMASVCLISNESAQITAGQCCDQLLSRSILRQKCALYLQLLSIRC